MLLGYARKNKCSGRSRLSKGRRKKKRKEKGLALALKHLIREIIRLFNRQMVWIIWLLSISIPNEDRFNCLDKPMVLSSARSIRISSLARTTWNFSKSVTNNYARRGHKPQYVWRNAAKVGERLHKTLKWLAKTWKIISLRVKLVPVRIRQQRENYRQSPLSITWRKIFEKPSWADQE